MIFCGDYIVTKDINKNAASVSALTLKSFKNIDFGFHISVNKKLNLEVESVVVQLVQPEVFLQ